MKKLNDLKMFIAKNKPLLAVAIVATATVAYVAIDLAMRENAPIEFAALKDSE